MNTKTDQPEEQEEDIRADVMSAMNETEATDGEPAKEETTVQTQTDAAAVSALPDTTEGQPSPEPVASQAPTSWSKEGKEAWGTIPENIRREITRREEASIRGVEKLKQQLAPLEELGNGLSPYINEAIQGGVHPVAYISSVLNTERVLRTGDNKAKFQEILRVCDQYGVPLRQMINMSVGQKVLDEPQPTQQVQLPPEIMREIEESRRFRVSISQEQANSEIHRFASDPNNIFFDRVREDMADLIDQRVCGDLKSAYEMAVFRNPELREEMIRRKVEEDRSKNSSARRTAAVTAAPSPANQTPAGIRPPEGDGSVADDIRNSILQLSGRV